MMIDLITLALARQGGGGSGGGVTPQEMQAAISSAIAAALENVGAETETTFDAAYNLTVSLKNADGDVLATDTINMPLEEMVVGGAYDDGVLTLTLKTGATVDIPISDIVSGLVPDDRTIAGITLGANITAAELREAINVDDGAQVNVKPDWNAAEGAAAEILNKPDPVIKETGGKQTVHATNNQDTPIMLQSSSAKTEAFIGFANGSGQTLGYFGVDANKRPVFYDTTNRRLALYSELPSVPSNVVLGQNSSGAATQYTIKVVTALPSDAASHPTTIYLVTG